MHERMSLTETRECDQGDEGNDGDELMAPFSAHAILER
jgi:hypothetical protein